MRRLTDRQVAVLAAIERLGSPTLSDLQRELPALTPSEMTRVIAALVIRGLVAEAGEPLHHTAVPRDSLTGRRDSVSTGE